MSGNTDDQNRKAVHFGILGAEIPWCGARATAKVFTFDPHAVTCRDCRRRMLPR